MQLQEVAAMYVVYRRDQFTNHRKSNISADCVRVEATTSLRIRQTFQSPYRPSTTSVSRDQASQARATPVTNLTSSHNTMASPTSPPSAAGTALKRYLIRPRNEHGSTSQFRPLSPFQRPDLKHLRRTRSISRETPACQRARDHGP